MVTISKIDSGVAYASINPESVLAQKYLPMPTKAPLSVMKSTSAHSTTKLSTIAPTQELRANPQCLPTSPRLPNFDAIALPPSL